ncbi:MULTISPECIES: S9 family peptidase [unclassified Rathayibacter]|uniref:alpha/beta hydrolase family protein n=1 Tax=unclassified Rathayibacter TaxID=2609250 RepID=UPI000CE739CD|nr:MULTISPECIES: alpha/beta fold hydrolase [unclassified Rathayibacter]PPF14674.1 alpha/beta hydrolase [Rathayibacter sp. AY1A4]PPF52928.1 alpha/beta hydrolase [Rathayibacter sp. AY1C2]PPG55671.1 alpha/beta hydrolase [Rathayibacter sp. AY1C5]PPG57143.1 alpha/beta hydrolase [Rathayibacter sp. AY1C7]PPH34735.1 alpha/beta hydrolase [Rathayibacter sp. AY1E3]
MSALWVAIPAVGVGVAGAAVVATVARRVIRPQRSRPTPIVAVPTPDRIVLGPTPITKQNGKLGLLYDDETRHAVLGPILRSGPDGIERILTLNADAPSPTAGSLSRPIGNVFATARELDPDAREVTVETELGQAPAWLFSGKGDAADTWAIHIHGSLSGRDAAFRSVHALRGTGYTSLVPSFRGDGEGPTAPLNAFTLGQTEWVDVDAAIALALERGARRVVLVGWSSGASMALRLATSSSHRSRIAGLILVSPVLSWRNSVLFSAANAGVPRVVAAAATWALGARGVSRLLGSPVPLNFKALDWIDAAAPLRIPVLLIHSGGDRTTPFSDSRSFSNAHVNATLIASDPAGHALEWNADPERFESAVRSWCNSAI